MTSTQMPRFISWNDLMAAKEVLRRSSIATQPLAMVSLPGGFAADCDHPDCRRWAAIEVVPVADFDHGILLCRDHTAELLEQCGDGDRIGPLEFMWDTGHAALFRYIHARTPEYDFPRL